MRGILISSTVGSFRRPSPKERLAAFIIQWLITAASVWVAAALVGGIHLEGWQSTLLVALILGGLNAILRPILVLGALPAIILTLGLGLILINTALLGLTAWIAGKFDNIQFHIDDFWAALMGAIIIAIVGFIITRFIRPERIARDMVR